MKAKKEKKEEYLEIRHKRNDIDHESKSSKNITVKKSNLEKVVALVERHRRTHLKDKHFEIRNLQSQVSLNGKMCKIVDVKETLFESRATAKVLHEDKQISLKFSNLVDISADIRDLVDTRCSEGHLFGLSQKPLKTLSVLKTLKKIITWAEAPETVKNRLDHIYRIKLLKNFIESGGVLKGENPLLCMDLPNYSSEPCLTEDHALVACLAAIRPGCVGTGKVDFPWFNQLLCSCDQQIMKRFQEYVVSGMCHQCQAYYIEREEAEADIYGSLYTRVSKVMTLDGLQIRT